MSGQMLWFGIWIILIAAGGVKKEIIAYKGNIGICLRAFWLALAEFWTDKIDQFGERHSYWHAQELKFKFEILEDSSVEDLTLSAPDFWLTMRNLKRGSVNSDCCQRQFLRLCQTPPSSDTRRRVELKSFSSFVSTCRTLGTSRWIRSWSVLS